MVLNGILYVFTEGSRWRSVDLPGISWNSVYQYYRRWCRDGVWTQLWDLLSPAISSRRIFIDSTHVKIHQSGVNPQGGQAAQAIGRTKGGSNTKIHAAVDANGIPCALLLSAGNDSDIAHANDLMMGLQAQEVVADKGYDCDEFRIWLFERGMKPCIPAKSNRLEPLPISRASYKKRHLVENFFASIKTFRRVGTRYDKLAETFFGWVLLAVTVRFGF